jgi:hypothetical protein
MIMFEARELPDVYASLIEKSIAVVGIPAVGRATRDALTPVLFPVVGAERLTEFEVLGLPENPPEQVLKEKLVGEIDRHRLTKRREIVFRAKGADRDGCEETRGPPHA